MQNTTLSDEKIIDLLNDKFYYINLDAEQENDIIFGDTIFKFRPTGISTGVHELAEQLATINNRINFPTVCILSPNNEIIFQYDQFINARKLEPILQRLSKTN